MPKSTIPKGIPVLTTIWSAEANLGNCVSFKSLCVSVSYLIPLIVVAQAPSIALRVMRESDILLDDVINCNGKKIKHNKWIFCQVTCLSRPLSTPVEAIKDPNAIKDAINAHALSEWFCMMSVGAEIPKKPRQM